MTGHLFSREDENGTRYQAEVFISFKPVVNDPEGLEILHGLHMLGFLEVERVRSGKFITMILRAESEAEAEARVREMSDKLLSNPIIEDYRIAITREVATAN